MGVSQVLGSKFRSWKFRKMGFGFRVSVRGRSGFGALGIEGLRGLWGSRNAYFHASQRTI